MPGIDAFTKRHLKTWLELHLEESERYEAQTIILRFINENPWAIDPDRVHQNITYFEMLDRGRGER